MEVWYLFSRLLTYLVSLQYQCLFLRPGTVGTVSDSVKATRHKLTLKSLTVPATSYFVLSTEHQKRALPGSGLSPLFHELVEVRLKFCRLSFGCLDSIRCKCDKISEMVRVESDCYSNYM